MHTKYLPSTHRDFWLAMKGPGIVKGSQKGVVTPIEPFCHQMNKIMEKEHRLPKSERKHQRMLIQNKTLIERRKASKLSDGEKEIAKALDALYIDHEREVLYKGLINPKTKCPLFFDFFISKYKIAVEFDGPQHFKPVYGEAQFMEQKMKDKIKNVFCNKKGILLLRIPYWKKDVKHEIYRFLEKHIFKP